MAYQKPLPTSFQELNEELDEWMEEVKKRPERKSSIEDKTVDEIWDEIKNHPAFMTEFDPTQPMSPELEGLMALKYESESPEYNAESYKDEGNDQFKKKMYKWATDSYQEGIKQRCRDRQLNCVLYCNKAAAQFHLGNYRSALKDIRFALKFNPKHVKALVRGAQCSIKLKEYDGAMNYCDEGLELDAKDPTFIDLRQSAEKAKKEAARAARKEAARLRKLQEADKKLVAAIKSCGVNLADVSHGLDQLSLSSLESSHPSGGRVHVDQQGSLVWPVLFVYPEHGQTDYIQEFKDDTRFCDHMDMMFGIYAEPAPWDSDRKYKLDNLEIYYEVKSSETLVSVSMESTLQSVLRDKRFVVYGGTPNFIVIVKDSPFAKNFLTKYKFSKS